MLIISSYQYLLLEQGVLLLYTWDTCIYSPYSILPPPYSYMAYPVVSWKAVVTLYTAGYKGKNLRIETKQRVVKKKLRHKGRTENVLEGCWFCFPNTSSCWFENVNADSSYTAAFKFSIFKLKNRHTALSWQTANRRHLGREKWKGAAEVRGITAFIWFMWQGFGSERAAEVASVRRCQKLLPCEMEPVARQNYLWPKLSPSLMSVESLS